MTTASASLNSSPALSVPRRFSESRLIPDTAAMAWRSALTMLRNPAEFFDVLIQPVLFTVMFGELLGGAISGDVRSYLPILVPGLVITNVLSTCQSVGVDLREDMSKGVFDRFRALPMSRLAPLLGPMATDLLRYAVCAALTVATGVALGYRPENGWIGAVGVVLAAAACGWAISWVFLMLGTLFSSAQAVTSFNIIILFPLCYLSNALVPVDTLPHWLKIFAEHNPVSYAVSGLRYLLDGTAGTGTAADAGWALLGCVLIVAVAAPITVTRYQRSVA
ncbi:ABC transporter permease [Actinomyces procaprae]|uniref:ABC transporter permease n=1 Tax=Actinomyces procaprae TaxID=2560010 RepID=UPI001F028AFB|nr:ABC transporter permease [Actinomyces procaprae]